MNLQKIMALPLLPPGEIRNGLAVIEEALEGDGLQNHFTHVVDHVKNYWLNDSYVGVDVLSVFEMDSRTDNDVERGHFLLQKKVGQSRPNLWVLTSKF